MSCVALIGTHMACRSGVSRCLVTSAFKRDAAYVHRTDQFESDRRMYWNMLVQRGRLRRAHLVLSFVTAGLFGDAVGAMDNQQL